MTNIVAELIARLRTKRMRVHDLSGVGWEDDPDCIAAADAIASLVRERDEANKMVSHYHEAYLDADDAARNAEARATAAEARLTLRDSLREARHYTALADSESELSRLRAENEKMREALK